MLSLSGYSPEVLGFGFLEPEKKQLFKKKSESDLLNKILECNYVTVYI
jgi:hypothetical protein